MRLDAVAATARANTPSLPLPHASLTAAGLRLRRGQTSLTVAAPGVGKSMFWLNIAMRSGVPTVFWSADTDPHDVRMRSIALLSGHTMDEVGGNRHDAAWAAYYTKSLGTGRHIDWVFDAQIQPDILGQRIEAFAEVRGDYPHLIVTDNLSNAVQHQADSLAEEKDFMVGMQRLARNTGAHVAVLAHAKGEYDNGTKPIPQNGVLNNLAKIPESVITLFRASDSGDELGVVIAKNRGGRADPAAKHPIRIAVDYARASITGFDAAVAA